MAIRPKTLNEVSPHLRQMFERGKTAIVQKNYAYAFQILREALRAEPGFVEARLALRQAQLERVGNRASLGRQAGAFFSTLWTVYLRGPALLKKGHFSAALDAAESALQKDPTLITSINFMVRVAQAAGLIGVAINALEVGGRFNPKNIRALRMLATLYAKIGEDDKALQVLQRLCQLRPNDLSLQNELRQATATAAMKQGWNKAESYRDVIRDRKQAEILEQQQRLAPRDSESLDQLIAAAETAVTEQPNATNHRRLADLYRRKGEYDKAIEHYNAVVEITGALDPAIDRALTEVLAARFDAAIKQWEEYAQANPGQAGEARAKIAELEQQKNQMLFERMEARVRRYPNEAGYRFEYAQQLFERERYDEALSAFQQAARNPKFRRQSAIWMGRCLARKGMTDLAVERLEGVLAKSKNMDDVTKECLYYLGSIYKDAGKNKEALEAFKRIYAADVNYRDVSRKLEEFYRK